MARSSSARSSSEQLETDDRYGNHIQVRLTRPGRYLVICQNRNHYLNNHMFGFVTVVNDDGETTTIMATITAGTTEKRPRHGRSRDTQRAFRLHLPFSPEQILSVASAAKPRSQPPYAMASARACDSVT